ncbi:MAG: hypothetical protein A3G31_03510 [Candidatus Schekmanbacteria bacterium RIFCSPLOWO2_12_FULL_38_15]|uniref:DUF86 domain-containing protein n=1 Tax=Candidatus Schekmanbacteria bacterium RIFCSPLOWO2_12_FULL_38_15 TaxID=1817883 RepID=A0A1F7SC08_9BACT|nr:MAG: hypothetical protein A3G31_03510 [Candidatus Schekmanbacteria bacterium RIFCSPLOWO2_12_FULL_38_15]
MQKDDFIRLRHMLDAAKEAIKFAKNKTRDSLEADRMLTLSIVKDLEIIGEAASNATKECLEELPRIPWQNIISMRNRLIHGYFNINLDILWKTVTEDIPPLIAELDKIVPSEDET